MCRVNFAGHTPLCDLGDLGGLREEPFLRPERPKGAGDADAHPRASISFSKRPAIEKYSILSPQKHANEALEFSPDKFRCKKQKTGLWPFSEATTLLPWLERRIAEAKDETKGEGWRYTDRDMIFF